MTFLISNAWAQGGLGGGLVSLLLFVLICAVFYLLLVRLRKKRAMQHKTRVEKIQFVNLQAGEAPYRLDWTNFLDKCEIPNSEFNKKYAGRNKNWQILKDIYEAAGDKTVTMTDIPKVMHFIWLGKPIPKWYKENIEDWGRKNPKFEIKLWGNNDSESFLKSRWSYKNFAGADSFGIKCDILRYEILLEHGGMYVDTDFLCTSDQFEYLHERWSFYAGIIQQKYVVIGNGIIASSPNHPIIQRCVNEINNPKLGNTFMEIKRRQTRVLYQTGPFLLTRSMLSYLHDKEGYKRDMLIFPSQTFHPFPSDYRHNADENLIKSYIKPHSMACHLWHTSWQPDTKFYMGRGID